MRRIAMLALLAALLVAAVQPTLAGAQPASGSGTQAPSAGACKAHGKTYAPGDEIAVIVITVQDGRFPKVEFVRLVCGRDGWYTVVDRRRFKEGKRQKLGAVKRVVRR